MNACAASSWWEVAGFAAAVAASVLLGAFLRGVVLGVRDGLRAMRR